MKDLNDKQIAALRQASTPVGLVYTGSHLRDQAQGIERNTANRLHVHGYITATASGNMYVEFGITDAGRELLRTEEM